MPNINALLINKTTNDSTSSILNDDVYVTLGVCPIVLIFVSGSTKNNVTSRLKAPSPRCVMLLLSRVFVPV